jgi:hypothetical protein
MPIKIAMIGAGSIGFTRRLMHDILAVPELADTTFALMDISQANLDMVTQLCERDIRANGLPARIVSTADQRAAIEMLVAEAQWLPQYAADIPRAAARLAGAEHNGTRVKTRDYQGAARLQVKTVAEMVTDADVARANAQAADKGMMTKNAQNTPGSG